MKNKNVGWLIIGISVFIGVIIFIFNKGLRDIISATCSHGPTCSMNTTLSLQTWLSISIALVVFFIGLFLVLSKENERVIVKKIKPSANIEPRKFNPNDLKKLNLNQEEKKVMNMILENNGSIFQSSLVEKTGLGKVRITRILDSLEGRGLIERKRRGMTNIIILKR